MKSYSFIRENVGKVLSLNGLLLSLLIELTYRLLLESKTTEKKFLFAPTLLYRDDYPRNTTIRFYREVFFSY